MVRIMQLLILTLAAHITATFTTLTSRRDERGEAVGWLIVVGAAIAIAYFAGDSVMAFAKNVVANLGD
jgi:hypothetical protein